MINYGVICYLSRGGETLMIDKTDVHKERDPNSGMIVAPGGRLKLGEGIYDCVRREIHEETGAELIAPWWVGTVLYDNTGRTFGDSDYKDDFFVWVFKANNYQGSIHKGTDEGIPKWVNNSRVKDASPRACDKDLCDLVNVGRNFSTTYKYNGEALDTENSRTFMF